MTALDVTMEHGARAGSLPGPHRDPFDGMLITDCNAEGMTLVSADRAADDYGVRRIW